MADTLVDIRVIEAARDRIAQIARRTPLITVMPGNILLKCENHQRTGSFKIRGAINKMLQVPRDTLEKGVVAASSGNHGLGVAFAALKSGTRATIYVPSHATSNKTEAIRTLGGEVIRVSGDFQAAEAAAMLKAEASGSLWIASANDPEVIAGQGTIGLEIKDQLPEIGDGSEWEIFLPIGGGGLASGVGIALRTVAPRLTLVGAQTEASPYMKVLVFGGDVAKVVETPTLADGLSGPANPSSITIGILKQVLDEIVLVTEDDIVAAMCWAYLGAGQRIEPSSAVALAAALHTKTKKKKVVILSGGNVDAGLQDMLFDKCGQDFPARNRQR